MAPEGSAEDEWTAHCDSSGRYEPCASVYLLVTCGALEPLTGLVERSVVEDVARSVYTLSYLCAS